VADAAQRGGLRQWRDMLAAASGLAEGRRLVPSAPGAAEPASEDRRVGLVEGFYGFGGHPGEKGGEKVGPNPTDRGKPGSKRHLVTDRNGIPLVMVLTGANVHDSRVFEDLLDGIELIKGARGRPRRRPEKLHADKGYDARKCRKVLKRRGIKSRIARKGKESSERLGRHRWVVERTLAWMARYRRLAVRYERRANIHEAFLHLGCSLICFNYLS
jgi:transposase